MMLHCKMLREWAVRQSDWRPSEVLAVRQWERTLQQHRPQRYLLGSWLSQRYLLGLWLSHVEGPQHHAQPAAAALIRLSQPRQTSSNMNNLKVLAMKRLRAELRGREMVCAVLLMAATAVAQCRTVPPQPLDPLPQHLTSKFQMGMSQSRMFLEAKTYFVSNLSSSR